MREGEFNMVNLPKNFDNDKNNSKQKNNQRSMLYMVIKALLKNRLAVIGFIIIGTLIIIGIFADFIAPYDYDEQDLLNAFQKPSSEHWFGTDEFGRDIFSRVVYGTRISLKIGLISVSISLLIGGSLGAVSGFYGGKLDNLIMRIMDIFLAIPSILLAISIVAALGTGITNLMIAVGISSIPSYARIVRASVLSIRSEEFIEAARASGTSDIKIITKHIIPNCLAPVIVQSTLSVANAILTAAGMSFIGLGIQPPEPEWGTMLSSGRGYIRGYGYMTLFPGLAMAITVLSMNLLGDGLRDALDPKLKN